MGGSGKDGKENRRKKVRISDEKNEELSQPPGYSRSRVLNSNSVNEKPKEADINIFTSLNKAAKNIQSPISPDAASIGIKKAVPNQPNPVVSDPIPVPVTEFSLINRKNRTNDSKTEQIEEITLSDDDDDHHHHDNMRSSPTNSTVSMPPTEKRLDSDFFVDKNHQTFSNFFTADKEASTWDLLIIYVPEDGGTMTFLFNGILVSLPNLHTLTLHFCKEYKNIFSYDGVMNRFNVHFVPFFQLLLNGAPNLKQLELICGRPPRGMGYLALPPTLTRVTFGCEMNDKELEVLIKNELPVLQTLYLLITNTSISEHILTRIFGKFSSSIRKLGFLGKRLFKIPRNPSYFRFTKTLEHLEVFKTNSIHAELAPYQSFLQDRIPNLKTLWLPDQTLLMFYKWTMGSCYPSVNELLINLVREDYLPPSPKFNQTIKKADMELVFKAFPKVSTLRLTVSCRDKSGLQYVFMLMSQLRELEIRVNNKELFTNTDHWDTLMIGTTTRAVSIRMLQSLNTLSLWTETTDYQRPIMSSAVFFHAFFVMPRLKRLKMEGSFEPTPDIIQVWKRGDPERIFYKDH